MKILNAPAQVQNAETEAENSTEAENDTDNKINN